jgi:glutamine synthetase
MVCAKLGGVGVWSRDLSADIKPSWNADGTPNKFNHRHDAEKLMEAHAEHEPWFGLEQEYTLLDLNDRPYGWPANGYPAPQGP